MERCWIAVRRGNLNGFDEFYSRVCLCKWEKATNLFYRGYQPTEWDRMDFCSSHLWPSGWRNSIMFLIVFLSRRFWLIFPSSLMFGSCLSVYWLKEGKVPHMNISRHNMPPKSLISDVEYERVSPLIYAYVSFFSSSKVGYHSGPPMTWADFGISCDEAKWFAACHFRSSFRSIFFLLRSDSISLKKLCFIPYLFRMKVFGSKRFVT